MSSGGIFDRVTNAGEEKLLETFPSKVSSLLSSESRVSLCSRTESELEEKGEEEDQQLAGGHGQLSTELRTRQT